MRMTDSGFFLNFPLVQKNFEGSPPQQESERDVEGYIVK